MSDPSEQPRRRRRQQPPPAPQGSPTRGIALVVVALVIGVILLRDDDAATTAVAVGTDTPVVDDDGGDGGDGTDTSSTTTTTAAPRPPSQVKVLVANGSSVNGAAGTQTDELEALGYVTATPGNAERVPATVIYYTAGFEPEARALATQLGLAETAVAMLPAVAPVDDLQLSNLLLVLGPDLAGG